jgi:hypothetical protein
MPKAWPVAASALNAQLGATFLGMTLHFIVEPARQIHFRCVCFEREAAQTLIFNG